MRSPLLVNSLVLLPFMSSLSLVLCTYGTAQYVRITALSDEPGEVYGGLNVFNIFLQYCCERKL